jgi:transaldolase
MNSCAPTMRFLEGRYLAAVSGRLVSLEVFADDFDVIEAQDHKIAFSESDANVKVPITNTKRKFSGKLIEHPSKDGIIVHVTAIFTVDQVTPIADLFDSSTPAIISVFAGCITDTGVDPIPAMAESAAFAGKTSQGRITLDKSTRGPQCLSSGEHWLSHVRP